MAEKLKSGESIDVSSCERRGGFYVLSRFVEDVDYCDAQEELWIWSIGKSRTDGTILASLGVEFYQNPNYECLWLR